MSLYVARADEDHAFVACDTRYRVSVPSAPEHGEPLYHFEDCGGKLQMIPCGWAVSVSLGRPAKILRLHQVADLCGLTSGRREDISRTLQATRERWLEGASDAHRDPGGRPPDCEDEADHLNHMVAVLHEGEFARGQFDARGKAVRWGHGATIIPSKAMKAQIQDDEALGEELLEMLKQGETPREAADAVLATMQRGAELVDDVSGDILVGGTFRDEEGVERRYFTKQRFDTGEGGS